MMEMSILIIGFIIIFLLPSSRALRVSVLLLSGFPFFHYLFLYKWLCLSLGFYVSLLIFISISEKGPIPSLKKLRCY